MAGRFRLRKVGVPGSRLRARIGGPGVYDVLRGRTIFDPPSLDTFPPNAEACETEDKKGYAKLKKRPDVG